MEVAESEPHTLIHHFGLPFYYRHTPSATGRRGIFWACFLLGVIWILVNLMLMPFDRSSILGDVRASLFHGRPVFRSFEDAGRGLFTQCYVFAILLSGIFSPLVATSSLSNERAAGTMEFLRLAPLSTTGIVLGKMFAPAWWMHVLSAAFIAFGAVVGLLSGLNPVLVLATTFCILLSCAVMHALGAFFAAQTTVLRGFGAVAGLLGVGFLFQSIPIAAVSEAELSFWAALSPWGSLVQYFGLGSPRGGRYANYPQFYGSTSAAHLWVIATLLLFFVLLVRAATRKLDRPERTTLTARDYMLLWMWCVFSAAGAGLNVQENHRRYINKVFEIVSVMLGASCGVVCLLAFLDHPHRRELLLTEFCERRAGRDMAVNTSSRLRHAYFVALMTFCTLMLIGIAVLISDTRGDIKDWKHFVALLAAPVFFFFLWALLLETSALRFRSWPAQFIATLAGGALLLACILTPLIHVGNAHNRRQYANHSAIRFYQQQRAAQSTPKQRNRYYEDFESLRMEEGYAPYVAELTSLESAWELEKEYDGHTFKVFAHYHPLATLVYPTVLLLVILGIFWWRKSAYQKLWKEASKTSAF